MKHHYLALLILFLGLFSYTQTPIGAWQGLYTDSSETRIKLVVIYSEGYQVATHYHAESGAFIDTNGGSWELEENIEQLSKDVAIVKKENELQNVLIEEVKKSTSNPLGG